MRALPAPESGDHTATVEEFFDCQYREHQRYWWREDNRYSLEPTQHTLFNSAALRLAARRPPGRALDVGAGEGADAIRLAKLGYEVDVIELSSVACEKIASFARAEGVRLNIKHESALTAILPDGVYDLVIMNGLLHYVEDKQAVLRKVTHGSTPGALHVISLFSTATPVPPEHAVVPVFPDSEYGAVAQFYERSQVLGCGYQRAKAETSHPGFSDHVHSYIKMIARLSNSNGTGA